MLKSTNLSSNDTLSSLLAIISKEGDVSENEAILLASQAKNMCLDMLENGNFRNLTGQRSLRVTTNDEVYTVGLPGIGIDCGNVIASKMAKELDKRYLEGNELYPMGQMGMVIVKRGEPTYKTEKMSKAEAKRQRKMERNKALAK